MDKLLDYFIKEPEREFHVRELANLMRKSPTTISKYLNKFKNEGLLTLRRRFNHFLYKANTESYKFKAIKLSHNLRSLSESGLIGYLEKEFNYPQAIVVFGSYRKAEDDVQSDIDIVIITSVKKRLDLFKFENILGRKIQLFLYSYKEIEKMKSRNKELLNNMVNGIVLYGFWEIFQ